MGGGLEYLAGAEGIVDQWQVFFGIFVLICLGKTNENNSPHTAWFAIVIIFVIISLILIILKIVGIDIPKMALMIIYIVGAIVVFLTAVIVRNSKTNSMYTMWVFTKTMCLSISMAIFYAYGAVLSQGK